MSGEHVYTIVYRVDGALNEFPDHDELYWNAIGADWNVQIDQATARVTGPAPVTKVACFTGPAGSKLGCAKAVIKNGAAIFSQPTMPPYNAT